MLLEMTADGVEIRWENLKDDTRQFLNKRFLPLKAMAMGNRRNTSFGRTTCALAEQLNAAHMKTQLRRMSLVSILYEFNRDTHKRLTESYDKAENLRTQLG